MHQQMKTYGDHKCVNFILGTPGSGMQRVVDYINHKQLSAFYLDPIGYRVSHQNFRQWLWSLDTLYYLSTDPGHTDFTLVGYAQNWQAASYFPWRNKYFLHCSESLLAANIARFRNKANIQDDPETSDTTADITEALILLQQELTVVTQHYGFVPLNVNDIMLRF